MPETTHQASGGGKTRAFIGRLDDVFQVPAARLRCQVSGEVGVVDRLICIHTSKQPRYQVVFLPERTLLYRVGDPGHPKTFPERGKS